MEARMEKAQAVRAEERTHGEFLHFLDCFEIRISVGTILGIDLQRLDSFGDFCGRARRLDSKVKESILNRPRFLCKN
jgi:hypothetical protein